MDRMLLVLLLIAIVLIGCFIGSKTKNEGIRCDIASLVFVVNFLLVLKYL